MKQSLILTVFVSFLLGCKEPQVNSVFLEHEIAINADTKDWRNASFVYGEQKVGISAFNTKDSMYLCLQTAEEGIVRQILTRGMTLWLDSKGGKKKRLGIQFPLGLLRMERESLASRGERSPEELQEQLDRLLENQYEIKLLDAEGKRRLMQNGSEGIGVAMGRLHKNFIYEMRMPLSYQDSWGYAFMAKPGGTVGIILETPEIDLKKRPPTGRSQGGIGIRGPGMGRGGGMGGMGKGAQPGRASRKERPSQRPEPLKLCLKVKLAES